MVCVHKGCPAALWFQSRAETEAACLAAGWRFWRDGKAPPLADGTALCADHAGEAANYPPKKKGARR